MRRHSDSARATATVLKVALPKMLIWLRGMRGMSQAELARQSTVARSTISNIESGLTKNVGIETLLKLCIVLGVAPNYLLGISGVLLVEESPGLREIDTNSARTCGHCGRLLRIGEPHMPGECIMFCEDSGQSPREIALRFGFRLRAIEAILAEEHGHRGDIPPPRLIMLG